MRRNDNSVIALGKSLDFPPCTKLCFVQDFSPIQSFTLCGRTLVPEIANAISRGEERDSNDPA